MSFPAHAASVVNCAPVTCMPSPESPANRITARVKVRRGFATVAAGITVSLMVSIVLSVTAGLDAERPRTRGVLETLVLVGAASLSCYPNACGLARLSPALTAISAAPLELEKLHLRRAGEVAAAGRLDDDHVLDADGSPAQIVEARLDRHHVAGLEWVVETADARQLVDVETDPVARPMEEALVASAHDAGSVATSLHGVRNLCMDGPAGGAVPDQLDTAELGGQHRVVDPLELVRSRALHHGSRHVGEIVGGRGARKDVEDDALMGADGARALIVRVDTLIAARDDGVLGDAVVFHE